MPLDPADPESTGLPELARPPSPLALTAGAPEDPGGDAELRARLRRLSADRLCEILLRLTDSQGGEVKRMVSDALRKFTDTLASGRAAGTELALLGASAAMQKVIASIRKFSAIDAAVLITGESGTGKELAARAIHERSCYRAGPFVAVDCAALPATLFAGELFSHEKGSFTGAARRRIGRLESAAGGTLFLDEIGDLPLEQQARLLRFLRERSIGRAGGTRRVAVDARVICATTVDLAKAVRDGRFRGDLYYRLHGLSLHLPSLRERGGDLDLLAAFFLRKFAAQHGRTVAGFSDDAWQRMREHPWPGNVRELIGRIRRAVVMAEEAALTAQDLGLDHTQGETAPVVVYSAPRGPRISEAQLRAALRRADTVTGAARMLGVSRMTIYRSMRRYGIT